MSAATPDVPTSSDRAPAFNRPIAPAPDIDRDGEMLNYYFDSTWTTKDIADHFKLTVPQVAAWFQRSDIAALIDFVTAANDRRARDIARENLPGTIDILLRISRLRNDDKTSRAASSALITFARDRASAVAKRAAKQTEAQANLQSSAPHRSRTADPGPIHNPPDASNPKAALNDAWDESRASHDHAADASDHAPGRIDTTQRSPEPSASHPTSEPLHPVANAPRPLPITKLSPLSPPHRCAG